MGTHWRALKATSVVLGLALAAAIGTNFGCGGASRDAGVSADANGGTGPKETLSPDEEAIVKEVRASGINVMTATELKEALASETPPVVVDALSAESYAATHIKGSISLPLDQIQAMAAQQLPDKSARIVVYCASFHCGASTSAATALKKLGYTNVYDFKGGLKQWRELGWPVEGSHADKSATHLTGKGSVVV